MPANIKTTASAAGVVGGATGVANVKACDFVVNGTFAGTWQFQTLMNDEWVTLSESTTGMAFINVEFSQARQVRFNVSAFTSGTFGFNLSGRN